MILSSSEYCTPIKACSCLFSEVYRCQNEELYSEIFVAAGGCVNWVLLIKIPYCREHKNILWVLISWSLEDWRRGADLHNSSPIEQ